MNDHVNPAVAGTDFTLSAALAALSEGFCPYGHQGTPVTLHGERQLACYTCGCSWILNWNGTGQIGGCACVPGDHSCGVFIGRPW